MIWRILYIVLLPFSLVLFIIGLMIFLVSVIFEFIVFGTLNKSKSPDWYIEWMDILIKKGDVK